MATSAQTLANYISPRSCDLAEMPASGSANLQSPVCRPIWAVLPDSGHQSARVTGSRVRFMNPPRREPD